MAVVKTETKNHPTPEQIAAWKKEHGDIYKLTSGAHTLIMRAPKLADLERAMASDPKKQKPFNFNRSIMNNCKLYESEGLSQDDSALAGIYGKMDELIQIAEVEMEKL